MTLRPESSKWTAAPILSIFCEDFQTCARGQGGVSFDLLRMHLSFFYSWGLSTHDDDCFYYDSWRNNVVIAFGTLSSFLT